ncbi:MAG: response regulator transcription factor [bacterium]
MSNQPQPISIAVVEDDAAVRRSMQTILRQHARVQCVGTYGSAEEALQAIPSLNPQMVLMDINLPGMNGVECVRLLTEQLPKLQVIMLTVYDDDDDIFNSLAAGATGYLLKPVRAATLLEAIEEIHSGGAPMSTPIARRVVQAFKKPAPKKTELTELTARELEILQFLAKGFLAKEIALQLNMSYWTVVGHTRHIYEKLHVRSRSQAIAKYIGV